MDSTGFRIVASLQAVLLVAGVAAAFVYSDSSMFWDNFGPAYFLALLVSTGAWILEVLERRRIAKAGQTLPVQSFQLGPSVSGVLMLWVGLVIWTLTGSFWPAVVAYVLAMGSFFIWSFSLEGAERKWLEEHFKNR